ncbi:D-amino-acid oxidase [Actinoplanes campanulatus]|uniref:D-amino-acid oxidase n=1 Tax=Actinoplanes campanulatus TaxID=113559 RepID=A0A7W5FF72_9ACTN|nr:FAD-dependent oxidoreductase [Actinoplanes campanulatus]MBB3096204.1 D-amino-acid oxidase [Actinoplanes campanulatus]GGN14497.1 D-amino-acid oxidase [Actinoplanes campanulatus]GID36701.1 D-amino-acid oxidase [Actinoplanes campanulatus]
MGSVTVVGAGVIGLSVAYELAVAGHEVRIVADREAVDGVSGVAAAIWFPHDVDHSASVLDSAAVTYRRLEELAGNPSTGVHMRPGTVLSRHPGPDLSWTRAVPHTEPAELAGTSGIRCVVPLAETGTYLTWLRAAVLSLGVDVDWTEVKALADLPPSDAVVVAAGLRSAALLGDDQDCFPIRGQVVRLANPGLTEWITDSDNPDGLTYVVPRLGDVVCGGTGEVGSWDERIDPDIEAGILRRVSALVPELAGQPVLSRATGLRPGRSGGVRVEAVAGHDRPVYACYGHGGAGFTLSWGDAARIATLVGPA